MSRYHRQIDTQGNETQLPYTQAEEDAADANDLEAPARTMASIRAKRPRRLLTTRQGQHIHLYLAMVIT